MKAWSPNHWRPGNPPNCFFLKLYKENVVLSIQWNIIQPQNKEILLQATTWMNLEDIMLSKISQTQKDNDSLSLLL